MPLIRVLSPCHRVAFKSWRAANRQSQIFYSHRCRQKVTLIHCLCSALLSLSLRRPPVSSPSPLCLFPSVSQESSFFQAYFPWASADCAIAITPTQLPWWQVRVYSCSERKFNSTFDDISRMRCVCVAVCIVCMCRVRLIYLTDFYPSGKKKRQRVSGTGALSPAVWLRVAYERYCIRKWEIPTDIVQLYVNLSAAPPLGVSGLSVNGGFMRAVCLCVSVSSTETSQRSGGCPCLCQTSVSEQSVLTGSERCLIARCLFPVRRRKLDGIFGFCHTCLTNQ